MASPMRVARPKETAANERCSPQEIAEIAKVAYGLFERRGGGHGRDQEDWFEAERIVSARRRGHGRG